MKGKVTYLNRCQTKVMDDLSYAIDVFQKSDVELDDYIYEDDSVLNNDDSDCTSTYDSDCDEE